MNYVPPFQLIKQKFRVIGANGKARIDMKQSDFMEVLRLMLRAVAVDEAWYLNQYPDVADAIRAGAFYSAKHHFVEEGYFEGRMPYLISVDERWYQSHYPDVAAGIQRGVLESGAAHFAAHGYKEGRLPAAY